MNQNKIIFSGPVGAGKTTAIRTVSDIPPITTDVRPTDQIGRLKAGTAVAMDYGVLDLGDGDRVHLYGTPGQERFDFMWDILSDGAIGLVLLIANDQPDPLTDLRSYLATFGSIIHRTHLVVGVTRMDHTRRPGLSEHRRVLTDAGLQVPLFEIDARSQKDVSLLVQALLLSVDPRLDAASGRRRHARDARLRPVPVDAVPR